MARVISGLTPAFEGDVRLDGKALPPDVKHRDKNDLQRVQLVLQMPDVSFNPKKLVVQALGRPLEFYLGMNGADRDRRVGELLNSVPEMRTGWLEDHRATREAEQAMADVVDIGLTGCPFHTRCPLMIPGTCGVEKPPVHRLDQDHRITCHREIDELLEAPAARA